MKTIAKKLKPAGSSWYAAIDKIKMPYVWYLSKDDSSRVGGFNFILLLMRY
jgi:hypothetical protein